MPQSPIVNAAELYLTGLPIFQVGVNILGVDPGRARDSSNTSDLTISVNTQIVITQQGFNGVDILPMTPNRFYAVFVIGDSRKANPSGCILSLTPNAPLLPAGYDMSRRIGWMRIDGSGTNIVLSETGDGLSRIYYYSNPPTVLTGGAATTFSAGLVDLTTTLFAVPPYHLIAPSSPEIEVILDYSYLPALVGNTAQFAVLNGATAPIVRVGSGVVTTQIGSIRIPCLTTGAVTFRYRVSAGDSLTLLVVGFTDALSNFLG